MGAAAVRGSQRVQDAKLALNGSLPRKELVANGRIRAASAKNGMLRRGAVANEAGSSDPAA